MLCNIVAEILIMVAISFDPCFDLHTKDNEPFFMIK